MNMPPTKGATFAPASANASVGAAVREWRQLRRLSQMELALDVGISPRHLSFVETGRSRPGVDVLLALAERLDLPLRDRNAWLLSAGFAPRFGEQPLDSAAMAQVREALRRLLEAHDPYPGLVLDRRWHVVLANPAATAMISLLPPDLASATPNLFRVSLHPRGFAAITRNFEQWGAHLLDTLERLAASSRDPQTYELLEEVLGYPNVAALRRERRDSISAPTLLVPCIIEIGGATMSLFTTLTTFGTPRDITLEELCIELFYPADRNTEQMLRATRGEAPRSDSSAPPDARESSRTRPR